MARHSSSQSPRAYDDCSFMKSTSLLWIPQCVTLLRLRAISYEESIDIIHEATTARIRCFRRAELNVNILVDITHTRDSRLDTRQYARRLETNEDRKTILGLIFTPFQLFTASIVRWHCCTIVKMAKNSESNMRDIFIFEVYMNFVQL